MPKFCVRLLHDVTAYAEVVVTASNHAEAKKLATNDENRNAADWKISDGNYIRRDDVWVEDVERIDA